MTATPRFDRRHPMSIDRDDRVVVFVGLGRLFGANAKGVFRRCQVRPLEVTLDQVSRVLSTIAPDALVLDTHDPELKRLSSATRALLSTLEAQPHNPTRLPLIVLGSSRVSKEFHAELLRLGAIHVPTHLQSHRQLARLVRRVCGLVGTCCANKVNRPSAALTSRQCRRYMDVTDAD